MLHFIIFAATVANAHLFIQSPPPIPGSAPKDPLFPDGSNFPCHGAPVTGATSMSMPAGSMQPLIFDTGNGANTAVHGGGSCQISVTYETDKAKLRDPKNWYVIHSIEGGCPTNSHANLGGTWTGPSGSYNGAQQCNDTSTNGFDCVNQFTFQLPKGMKDGQATLAWTWFNAVGNREMYMNCVAIDITGGASDDKQMQDLPGMFVANLQASDLPGTCRTTEMTNVAFPQPGPVLEYKKSSPRMQVAGASSQFPISMPSACPDMARNGAGNAQPSVITSSAPNSGPTYAPPGGSGNPGAESPSASAPVPYATPGSGGALSVPVAQSSQSLGPVASNAPTTLGSGSCAPGSVPCETPGALVCPDSQHFGLCDINHCAVVGSVSAGTQCKNGVIAFADAQKRDTVHKRVVRYARGYTRHAHHGRV